MLILIAEAKSMCEAQPTADYQTHRPEFEANAETIIERLRGKSVAELSADLKLGPKNAVRLYEDIYNFNDKSTGVQALHGYTGVVFRALDASTLSSEALAKAQSDLRIVSSLYGLLRPKDIIKPYRLDYNMKIAPDGRSAAAYWRPINTDSIHRYISESGDNTIINLLPGEAAKCIDFKAIKSVAEVYDVNFQEYKSDGVMGAPHSEKLKRLRGLLLRHILTHNISDIKTLCTTKFDDMIFDADTSTDHILMFTTA